MLWAGGAVALAGSKVAGRWAVWQAMLAKSVAHKATAEMGSFRILMLLYDLPRPTRRIRRRPFYATPQILMGSIGNPVGPVTLGTGGHVTRGEGGRQPENTYSLGNPSM